MEVAMRTMTRMQLMHAFSQRLILVLKKKGFQSATASSGVKIKALAETLGCSVQIARRYALGESLPEPEQLLKIADWLEVSPGWLLFGEQQKENENIISAEIDMELLRHILTRLASLFVQSHASQALVEFAQDLIYDALHMKASKKTIFKMIDIAVQSAGRFHKKKRKIA